LLFRSIAVLIRELFFVTTVFAFDVVVISFVVAGPIIRGKYKYAHMFMCVHGHQYTHIISPY